MQFSKFVKFVQDQHPEMFNADARAIVGVVFDAMRGVLLNGDSVTIPGMCTLYPCYKDHGKDGVPWRNPASGEISTIYSKVQLRIRPNRSFQSAMTKRLIGG